MKIFQYAVIKHPTEDEKKGGTASKIIVPIASVLAVDQNQAAMLAGRAIPETELPYIDRLEVAVRPF